MSPARAEGVRHSDDASFPFETVGASRVNRGESLMDLSLHAEDRSLVQVANRCRRGHYRRRGHRGEGHRIQAGLLADIARHEYSVPILATVS